MVNRSRFFRAGAGLRGLAAALVLMVLTTASRAAMADTVPTLAISVYTKPANRPALRAILKSEQAGRLQSWKDKGLLSGYRLLFSRYADSGVWDGMEILTFPDDAAFAKWTEVERSAAGGLTRGALDLVESVETTPADRIRSGGPAAASAPVVLVVPYQALIPTADYVKYLDGYTLPQFNGWIAEGVLDAYDIALSRYPSDRRWSALITLRYRDDAALARRDEVLGKVRARLGQEPAWKAISDNKKAVRVEKALAVADQIAASEAKR